jgi:hypothetical protein
MLPSTAPPGGVVDVATVAALPVKPAWVLADPVNPRDPVYPMGANAESKSVAKTTILFPN